MTDTIVSQYLKKHGFGLFSPKAVLFDMDGVLYNSMPRHAISWHQSMASFGIDMPMEDAYRYEGMRGVETIKLLAREQWHRELSDEEAQHMYEVKSAYFNELPPPRKMFAINHLMQQIHDDGLIIGIVTGSGQHTLIDQLEKSFVIPINRNHIVTSYDVKQGKPAPAPYIEGMRKVHCKPWETIVVENAPLGIQSAVAAHCFTIGVNTGPLNDEELYAAGANLVLPSIKRLCRNWHQLHEVLLSLSKKQH